MVAKQTNTHKRMTVHYKHIISPTGFAYLCGHPQEGILCL